MNKFPVEIINLILEASQEKELLPWIQEIIYDPIREKKARAILSHEVPRYSILRLTNCTSGMITQKALSKKPSSIWLLEERKDILFWVTSNPSFKLFSSIVPEIFLFRNTRGNLHWLPLSLEDSSVTRNKDQSFTFNLLYNLEW